MDHIDDLIKLADRLVTIAENYWAARTKLLELVPPNAEVWKQGEPRPHPETRQEYKDLPNDGPGRFGEKVRRAQT